MAYLFQIDSELSYTGHGKKPHRPSDSKDPFDLAAYDAGYSFVMGTPVEAIDAKKSPLESKFLLGLWRRQIISK